MSDFEVTRDLPICYSPPDITVVSRYTMTCTKLIFALLSPIIVLTTALAEEPSRAYIGVFACEQQPQAKRSAVLVSQTGARAYIEAKVRVVATGRDEPSGEPSHKCRADWTLHVAAAGEDSFHPVSAYSFDEKFETGFSTDGSTYYGGSVLGWSFDGSLLLAYAQIGAWEDWFLPVPVVYSASEKQTWTVDLRPAFARRTPKDCDLHFNPLGFSTEGKVVFDVEPFEYVDQACFKPGRWVLDFRTKAVSPAARSTKPQIAFKSVVGKND